MKGYKHSVMKKVVLAAALAASVTGIANAADYNDNSMSRLGGDSYAYFARQPIDKSPSGWREANPQGPSEHWFQSYSVWGPAFKDKPVFSSIASDPTFKQTHPNGLTEGELQALSSEAPAWNQPNQPATGAFASTEDTAHGNAKDATGTDKPTLAQHWANFLHRLHQSASQPNQ